MIAALLLLWLICAGTASAIAGSKGHSAIGWFFGGLFLGVFAIIIVACIPARQGVREFPAQEVRRMLAAKMLPCPYCRAWIPQEATVCRYCRSCVG